MIHCPRADIGRLSGILSLPEPTALSLSTESSPDLSVHLFLKGLSVVFGSTHDRTHSTAGFAQACIRFTQALVLDPAVWSIRLSILRDGGWRSAPEHSCMLNELN